jgi:hypothetical protein
MKKYSDSAREKSIDPSNRRDFIKKASIGGLGIGILGASASGGIVNDPEPFQTNTAQKASIKIVVRYYRGTSRSYC